MTRFPTSALCVSRDGGRSGSGGHEFRQWQRTDGPAVGDSVRRSVILTRRSLTRCRRSLILSVEISPGIDDDDEVVGLSLVRV
ncbi:hypothetical protein Hdeb2414_s0499g00906011 [Helianthus debilis subsp. tardiflorus]